MGLLCFKSGLCPGPYGPVYGSLQVFPCATPSQDLSKVHGGFAIQAGDHIAGSRDPQSVTTAAKSTAKRRDQSETAFMSFDPVIDGGGGFG